MTLEAGLHLHVGEAEYHADPAPEPSLSSSLARILLDRSPLHAWTAHPRLNPDYEPQETKALDFGSCAHAILIGRGREIAIIEASDFKTKAAREARDQARADGKTPILPQDHARAIAMVKAARRQLGDIAGAEGAFLAGHPEPTLIWREGDIWCRARPDWLSRDVFDYKSTGQSANPLIYGRKISDMGFDVQAAFYERGLKALGLATRPLKFRFVPQENEPPYALSVVELDGEAMASGRREVERAIAIWQWCLREKRWPGYPPVVHRVSIPPYAIASRLEREVAADEAGIALSIRAQEPVA